MGFKKENEYVASAIHFANNVDKRNFKSVINYKGETYKYDSRNNYLVVVTKDGFIRTFYSTEGSGGFSYYPKKGVKKWIKV